MSTKRKIKPQKAIFTNKLTHPHDVYRGNTNHWSVMRTEGDTFVAKTRLGEREAKDLETHRHPQPHPGCSTAPFIWSPDEALKVRGHLPFYDLLLQGLGDELPGDLSKGLHKNYNKAVFHWPPNSFRTHAQENLKYWMDTDITLKLARHPTLARKENPV